MYTSIVTFFQEGGSFMVPIAIVLAIGSAIAIERYVYLTQSRARNRMLLKKIMPLMEKGDFKLAYSTSNKSKQPIAKILNSGLY